MAIAYGSAGTALTQSTAATSWAVAYPAGIAAGDVLVLHVASNGGAVTTPAGWTEIYRETVVTNPKGGLCIKVADGTESGTLTVAIASTTGRAQIHRYTGVDTTTPQDAAATSVSLNATTDPTIDLPAITTVTADAWLVYACASNSTTTTHTSAGANERADFAATKAGALYDIAVATPASTARTITQSAGRAYWGAMLALRPASTGPAAQTVNPSAVAVTAAKGTPSAVPGPVTAAPGGVAATATPGTPAAATATGTAPGGVAVTAGKGTPVVSTAALAQPAGVAVAAGRGTPALTTAVSTAPAGVQVQASEGTPTLAAVAATVPSGVAVAVNEGTPATSTPNGPQTVAPAGAAVAVTEGAPAVSSVVVAQPAGKAVAATLGAPGLSTAATLVPGAVAVTVSEGAPGAATTITASPAGTAVTATPAAPAALPSTAVQPDPAGTTTAAGDPSVSTGLTAAPGSALVVLFAGFPVAAVSQDQTCAPSGASVLTNAGHPTLTVLFRAVVGIMVEVDRWKAAPGSTRYAAHDDPDRPAAATSHQPGTAEPSTRWDVR